jgi:hypothetical protein
MLELISGIEGRAFKTELLHLTGGVADQTELQIKGNTAATY